MKYRINFELVLATLIVIGSSKLLIWKSIDPSNFSKAEKEEIGIGNVHPIITNPIEERKY